MARTTRARGTNLAPQTNLVPKKLPLTEREAAESFSAVVLPFSAGQLAKAARRTKETAKGWKNGRACPNGASLINLARQLPTVKAWLYAQIEREEANEFEHPQLLTAMMGVIQQLSGTAGPEGEMARRLMRDLHKSGGGDE